MILDVSFVSRLYSFCKGTLSVRKSQVHSLDIQPIGHKLTYIGTL